ncbi:MAG: hypothetical protein RL329_4102, partial [Bacteroidota bacterium]
MDFSITDYLGFSNSVFVADIDNTLPLVKRHYVRQAKELLFGIDKIHFLGEHPAVYFKSVPNFETIVLRELTKVHKSIWNQGKAPFLFVESPTEIRVYNGFEKPIYPKDAQQQLESLELFKAEKTDAKALTELKRIFGAVSIETGDFWAKKEHADKIKFKTRVEQALIDNLKETRRRLIAMDLHIEIIHDILLRSLFLLYLEDRKATDSTFYQTYQPNATSFFDILNDVYATYSIFKKLEVVFNGNLCPISEKEPDKVHQKHLDLIKTCFWSKTKQDDPQSVLFDWRIFDFSIIPIELISGIYEDFLSNEDGKDHQSQTGAFYTPRPLAEFILNKVLPYPSVQDTKYDLKVLDPTCGSGIFLVESLNRLLDRWEFANAPKKLDFNIICNMVKNNIFGIEQSKEAIKVAAFSLYLAMLNRLDPKKLWQNGKFPYLIYDPENTVSKKQGYNLFRMSTFDNGLFEKIEYDLIVGNPPFKRGHLSKEVSQYLKKYNFAQKAILAFLHRATTLCPKGNIALVCGIKPLLFNTGNLYQNFRDFLFEKTNVTEIYNFAILRKVPKEEGGSLFGTASAPTGIVFYSNVFSEKQSNRILYCAPKSIVKHRFMNGLAIDATDIKYLPRDTCKKPNSTIWKTAMWGTERDFSLIAHLQSYKSLADTFKEKGWDKNAGVGFRDASVSLSKHINTEIAKIPFIAAEKIERYYTSISNSEKNINTTFYRTGHLLSYQKPHLLLKTGQSDKKFCASFLDYDCSFKEAMYGIHIRDNENALKLLTAFFNSQLVTYILFLTTTSWGIEREQVKSNEMLNLPDLCFSLPKAQQDAIIACMDEIIVIKKQNLPIYNIDKIEKRIDNLFYEGLNLTDKDIVLIEDLIDLTLDGFQNRKESIAFHPTIALEMRTYSQYLSNA